MAVVRVGIDFILDMMYMSECQLIIVAALLVATSGFVVLFSSRVNFWLMRFSVALHIIGTALAIVSAFRVIRTGSSSSVSFFLPVWGDVSFVLDPLAALFLVPVFLISAVAAVYELDYCANHQSARLIRIFYGLMCGALGLVFCARHGILFLFLWEVMALAAFFLIAAEDNRKEVRESSWLYLACAHCSTLVLFVFFALIKHYTGSYDFSASTLHQLNPEQAKVIFILGLIGFGIKAGIFPFHFWLPPAHAAAPTQVSAVLSGVLIKVGIYGIVRTLQVLPTPPFWCGVVVLLLGAISALLGVMYALGQHDLKRLLAYHSIENIGIILLGFGVATIGVSVNSPLLMVLGFAGGMLHVWNHATFKSLLFFAAGSVMRAAHTRNIDRLGGLIKVMPLTALCFVVGAIAIVGLPPLNGFISELSVYIGLFQLLVTAKAVTAVLAAFCIMALCLTGAFALACFVKVVGCVFLGEFRGSTILEAKEVGPAMLVGPVLLALCCLVIGVFPQLVLPTMEEVAHTWALTMPESTNLLYSHFPARMVTIVGLVLCVVGLIVWLMWRRVAAKRYLPTWDCGYPFANARVQYTASSFAQTLVGDFHPLVPSSKSKLMISNFIPPVLVFKSHTYDLVLDYVMHPWGRIMAWFARKVRVLQSGYSQVYVLYILLTLVFFYMVS